MMASSFIDGLKSAKPIIPSKWSKAPKFLILSDQIDKQPLVFIIELGQIIGKITEIIADTHLDMIAQMAVYPQQHAAATVLGIWQVKPASLN
jgi:hypothetical protein